MLFTKMQALSNDFVVIDATQQPFSMTPEQIAQMGDRHRGVGFDQLLVIEPAHDHATADYNYRIFNADGTEVDQCGNGARCVALYIKTEGMMSSDSNAGGAAGDAGKPHRNESNSDQSNQSNSDGSEIVLQTKAMRLRCRLLSDHRVAVQMGVPKFAPTDIPFDPSKMPSLDLDFGLVNVGNPHALIQVRDVNNADLGSWGATLQADPRFPEGVNVSVFSIRDKRAVDLRVFERGVGETKACGSAACAVMVWGYQQGLLGSPVTVSQPGGNLEIAWQGADSSIEMIGPAEFVFRGRYLLL